MTKNHKTPISAANPETLGVKCITLQQACFSRRIHTKQSTTKWRNQNYNLKGFSKFHRMYPTTPSLKWSGAAFTTQIREAKRVNLCPSFTRRNFAGYCSVDKDFTTGMHNFPATITESLWWCSHTQKSITSHHLVQPASLRRQLQTCLTWVDPR